MLTEQVKSVILIFLIALSAFLTAKLWFEERPYPVFTSRAPEEERVQMGEHKEIGELIAPDQAIISLGDDKYIALDPLFLHFQRGWQQIVAVIAESPVREGDWQAVEPPDLSAAGVWQWSFPVTLNLTQWQELFAREGKKNEETPVLERLIITPEGDAFVYDGEGNYYLWHTQIALDQPLPEGLPIYQQPQDTGNVTFDPSIYLPTTAIHLPQLVAAPEFMPAESIANTFFADMSLVRKIHERDGAEIFTDGQRALRIYPSGAIEYNFPGAKAKESRLQLATAWDRGHLFVEQHGGWPDIVRVENIARKIDGGEEQYHFTFRQYYNGIPVFLHQPALALSINSSAVFLYERMVITPLYPDDVLRPVIAPQDLWEDVYAYFIEKIASAEQITITDLFLAYRGRQRSRREIVLEPVWVLEVNNASQIYINAYSGAIEAFPAAGLE
ncbi:MAG: two-component system activity regulator YycH [bacterium]|jgi:regulatory protein YycH of two-component signal transduction system YycFG